VQGFLDMFVPRQVAITKRIQELDIQIEKAQQELGTAQQKVYEDARGDERRAKITVTVLSEADGAAELLLTYGMFLVDGNTCRYLTWISYRRFQRILDATI
jgi:hypothetical protein